MTVELTSSLATRYQLLNKVGEGSMGAVYKARDARLERHVALKFLSTSRVDAGQWITDEARAIAALNHPNIATIYEIADTVRGPVLVLEYLDGGTLRGRLAEKAITPAEMLGWGAQIADALQHAHQSGIVHRDVKPENLLFTSDGRIKLTDFGVARFTDARTVLVDRQVAGTLKYMAPECLCGIADFRSDIFSLGLVLEEMAARAVHRVPEALHDLIGRAASRDREKRYQSVGEVGAALRAIHPGDQTPSAAVTILIVEDDAALRDVLESGLAMEGYRVVTASNGREGIRVAAEESPHLVLLDVTLPGANGFDVCRELRQRGFHAPIMMVTGKTDEIDRVVGLEIGADDYLTKPFGHRELVTRVRAHLRRAYGMDASRTLA